MVHIRSIQDNPVTGWKAIGPIYLQRKPGAWFATYDKFFGIRKWEDESLSALTARVDQAMLKIKELHPSDATNLFIINKLDNELVCMTLVCSLPQEYSHFTSSLLLLWAQIFKYTNKANKENSVTQKRQITWSTWKGNSWSNHWKCAT